MKAIDFWYEFASTYSYPAAMRIEAEAAKRGIAVHWRPFMLGPIFGAQGWTDSPFNIYPTKGAYMWKDLARVCTALGLPLKLPPFAFPQNGLKAARIAMAGADEGWVPAFTRAVYTANFAQAENIYEMAVLTEILDRLGLDPDAITARAFSSDNKSALIAQTEAAVAAGIFGAPSFTVGGELFWGNDRLDSALDFAVNAG